MRIDINVQSDEPQFVWEVAEVTDEVISDIEKALVDAVEYAYDEPPVVYTTVYTGPIVTHLKKLRDEYPDIFEKISLERISKLLQEKILNDLKRGLEADE